MPCHIGDLALNGANKDLKTSCRLMKSACGVARPEASASIVWARIERIPIPFANAELLWKLKQVPRANDEIDPRLCSCAGMRMASIIADPRIVDLIVRHLRSERSAAHPQP